MAGIFTATYSDYNLNPNFSDDIFDEIAFFVEPESNQRDSSFWEGVRPVPLTYEESLDYIRKDSIQEVREDPAYIDSVDRISNQIGIFSPLLSYSYQNRNKHFYGNFSGPLSGIGFNTVKGLHTGIAVDFAKYFDKKETRRLLWGGSIDYGWQEKQLRGTAHLTYRPSRLHPTEISIKVGRTTPQYNNAGPIGEDINTIYTLLNRRNHAKYYDKTSSN